MKDKGDNKRRTIQDIVTIHPLNVKKPERIAYNDEFLRTRAKMSKKQKIVDNN